jgi:hypothetical protein
VRETLTSKKRALDGNADQKGEQNVVSMKSLSTVPRAWLRTGQDSMPGLNLKSPVVVCIPQC